MCHYGTPIALDLHAHKTDPVSIDGSRDYFRPNNLAV